MLEEVIEMDEEGGRLCKIWVDERVGLGEVWGGRSGGLVIGSGEDCGLIFIGLFFG